MNAKVSGIDVKLSQARAMVVRQYLAKKFRVDDARLKTLGTGEDQKPAPDTGRVTIVVYPGARENRVIEAKNK
jgi:outer membrane protein OmpA-like peptidoglycan-associated protein